MVEGVTHEGEVAGSNPAGRVAREFCAKNATTCDGDAETGPLAGGGLPRFKKKIAIFFGFFSVRILEVALPSAMTIALGKENFLKK